MKASLRKYLLILLCLLLIPFSCARKGRVLSEQKMASLYVDMFLADQWLRNHTELRKQADTTDFFAPVFEKHHCSFEDYDASLRYYSSNPEKFSQVMILACEVLKGESERLSELSKNIVEANRLNNENAVKWKRLDFDTIYMWRSAKDSLAGVSDSLQKDSLAVASDSLGEALDSLTVSPDSLSKPLDSLHFERNLRPASERKFKVDALKKVRQKQEIGRINKDNK